MKKVSKTNQRKKADALFSKWIRRRDKWCQMCNKTENLQCSHVIGRLNHRLRYDPMNAIALCYRCHLQIWHRELLVAITWFQKKFPKRYEYLLKAKNEIGEIDYEEIIEKFKEVI